MDPIILATLLVALIVAAISLIFYFQSQGYVASVAYSIFVFTAAMWGFGVSLFLWTSSPMLSDLSARFLYLAGGFTAPAFYFFVETFISDSKLPRIKTFAIFVTSFILFILYFFSDFIIGGYFVTDTGIKGFLYGPGRLLFDIQLWVFMGLALLKLIKTRIKLKDENLKTQILYITLGTYIVLSIAAITNVFAPLLNIFQYIWIGPVSTIVWVILITYAITMHRLLNARLIATEIFVAIILIIFFIETSLSRTTDELIRKVILLIGGGIFSYLLIRGTVREAEQREKLEVLTHDLEIANEELKKLDQAKSEFLSIASHQLRSPLTAIKGYASMLLEGGFGKLSVKALEVITKMAISTENLIRLISDLLNLSRIESGKIQYEMVKNNVVKILDDAVDGLKIKAEKLELNLQFENRAGTELWAICDKDKIREVFINLVDNAVKYTKRNGKVLVSINRMRDQIRISVKDDGIGISPENIHKLFVKFARVEDAARVDPNGLGLGLYFAKKVVEDHGGKIWAESGGSGKGSTFFVELPFNKESQNL
ncbi:MAG: ATP-binding protein [Candidatus Sungbacteria bacterium]|nr:ATP-binding protein [Candidatus Sungbacteria bacterium]